MSQHVTERADNSRRRCVGRQLWRICFGSALEFYTHGPAVTGGIGVFLFGPRDWLFRHIKNPIQRLQNG